MAIDQDRDIETKGPDALGDLPHLLLAVTTGINGVRLKVSNRAVADFQDLAPAFPDFFGSPLVDFMGLSRMQMILHTGILEIGEPLEFRKRRKF